MDLIAQARAQIFRLVLASPGGRAAVFAMRRAIESGADVYDFVQRRLGGGESGRGAGAAIRDFSEWCDSVPEEGAPVQEAWAARAGLLTPRARSRLVEAARPTLSGLDARRVRRAELRERHARERFVLANQGLVIRIATGHRNRGIPVPDLIQEGNLGLLKAVERFDPELGYRFSTYCVWWIRHYMRRALSNHGRLVRLPVHVVEEQQKLQLAGARLAARLDRQPLDHELAKEAGLSPVRVRRLLSSSTSTPVSLDAGGDDRGISLAERLHDPEDENPLDKLLRSSRYEAVSSVFRKLGNRERTMLQMRFGLEGHDQHTLRQVGQHFGLSRERVRQIVTEAIEELKRAHSLGFGDSSMA